MADYRLNAGTGGFVVKGNPAGFSHESEDSQNGRFVDSQPAAGGRSVSRTDAEGNFTADLNNPLEKGRPNEAHVIKVLVKALNREGIPATVCGEAKDHFGEDGLLRIDGTNNTVKVQIVTVPVDTSLWKELAMNGEAFRDGDLAAAVALIREALLQKRDKATGTLLALDASHFSAIIGKTLLDAYLVQYGDPLSEFDFAAVWIVGQTTQSTRRLSANAY